MTETIDPYPDARADFGAGSVDLHEIPAGVTHGDMEIAELAALPADPDPDLGPVAVDFAIALERMRAPLTEFAARAAIAKLGGLDMSRWSLDPAAWLKATDQPGIVRMNVRFVAERGPTPPTTEAGAADHAKLTEEGHALLDLRDMIAAPQLLGSMMTDGVRAVALTLLPRLHRRLRAEGVLDLPASPILYPR